MGLCARASACTLTCEGWGLCTVGPPQSLTPLLVLLFVVRSWTLELLVPASPEDLPVSPALRIRCLPLHPAFRGRWHGTHFTD